MYKKAAASKRHSATLPQTSMQVLKAWHLPHKSSPRCWRCHACHDKRQRRQSATRPQASMQVLKVLHEPHKSSPRCWKWHACHDKRQRRQSLRSFSSFQCLELAKAMGIRTLPAICWLVTLCRVDGEKIFTSQSMQATPQNCRGCERCCILKATKSDMQCTGGTVYRPLFVFEYTHNWRM